jgi:predicted transcriptional regulator
MQRSKLEACVDIIRLLAENGSLKFTILMIEGDLTNDLLSGYIDFLLKQHLIKENPSRDGNRVLAITERGIGVLRFFKGSKTKQPQ